ncbi:negative regulator of sigma-Y activity [Planococcus glaciei]|uniref:PLDc_N domain-containing protein n=1 Tax=Planococcus glaciei TaxID=459472 RepID=A0A1G7WD82_9BACL|nr:PLD nuclease N-terminal domain-containing protein [Planococcus glaciei]MCP2033962.1 hypothetical protein [Planomicrobium sp. HSC-17F08]ETP69239.1 Negative regulatory protein yxlE [Planococcus glaciei CHR43]KOF12075.1 negative regulator of sigma-Y activity [Planococcus glaciei]MBX0314485.1 PLD nuclease N-terminal domain-containing protein [Planococcus glaciei]QDY45054.1 PLDc_N domain-containing protein [Planococcus glaciei]
MDQTTLVLLLLPIIAIQLGLMIFTLVDLVKNPNPNGPKWLWAILIVFVNILGPILYLVIGRRNY